MDNVALPALAAFRDALGDVPILDDPALVRQKSRDFFWYSPLLKAQLNRKSADLVALPRHEADVVRVAAACARHRIPLTVRGAGTGNYGQAVPLAGGIVLDMTALDRIEWQRPGRLRVGPGARLAELDTATRPAGWELRMHPSTKRTATIGGFVAGGSGGIGSVTWGGLREPGNVLAARVVTVEETPRVLELRGREVGAVNHAYGTTGIITALEMPLAPAWPWVGLVAAFPRFEDAVRFGLVAALADGIAKKLLTPIAWPIPALFRGLQAHCPEGEAILIAMIAEPSLETFRDLLARAGGRITLEAPGEEGPGAVPLYEYTWNHTTLQALKVDKGITYLQALYPADRLLESVTETAALFGDEVLPHLEFIRYAGRVTASGLPLVRYTTPERLAWIIAEHERRGITIANPHVYTLEEGVGHKRVDVDQLSFKAQADPYGLLNPGKMRSYRPAADRPDPVPSPRS